MNMSMKPLKILVVDDDKNFAYTLCAILCAEGYQCQEVHSAKDAQEVLKNGPIDCVLSDVKMPNQSGAEFYYEIKNQFPNLPFILMTAYTSSEIIHEALQSGVLTAIQKPINIQEILRFLARLSQSLQAAVVCEEQQVCDTILKILENERFTFTIYQSIETLINSQTTVYSIVFIDAHDYCEHYWEDVKKLLGHLPKRTIVIICDYQKTASKEKILLEKENPIILPREKTISQNIHNILQNKYYQHAIESIQ